MTWQVIQRKKLRGPIQEHLGQEARGDGERRLPSISLDTEINSSNKYEMNRMQRG